MAFYGPDGVHSITDPTPTPTQTTTTQTTTKTEPTTQTQTQTTPTYIPDTVQQRIEKEKKDAEESVKRQKEQNITPAKTTVEQKSSQESKKPLTKNDIESDYNYWLKNYQSSSQLEENLHNFMNILDNPWTSEKEKSIAQKKIEAIQKALELFHDKQGVIPGEEEIDGGDPTEKVDTSDKDWWTTWRENKGKGPTETVEEEQNPEDETTTTTTPKGPVGPSSYTNPWAFDPEKELETQKKHLEEMEKKRQGDVVPPAPQPNPNPEPEPNPQPEPEPQPQPEPTPEPDTTPQTEPVQQQDDKEYVWKNNFTNPEEKTYDETATTDRTPAQAKQGMYDNLYLIGSGNYQGNNGPNGIPNNANPNLYAVNYKSLFPNIN